MLSLKIYFVVASLFLSQVFVIAKEGAEKEGDKDSSLEATYDRRNWIDPHDMFGSPNTTNHDDEDTSKNLNRNDPKTEERTNGEHSKEQDHTEQTIHGTIQKLQDELSTCMKQRNTFKQDHLDCQVKASKATEPCDTPYFKQLVRKLMKTLKAQGFNPNGCYELLLSVSERDLETMEKFLDGTGDEKDELENVIEIFSSLKPVPHESVLLVLIEYFKNVNFSMLLYLAVPVLAIAIFVFAEIKVQASWKQQLVFMFFLCFALSIPWEWGRLYKMELAKKTAKSMTDIPEQCFPKKLTMFKSLKLWFEDTFTFRDDECVKYHEAILVDPLLEVSPSQAIAISATRFFFQPLEYVAQSLGHSFKIFFKEVPTQWHIPVFLAGLLVILVSLFAFSGFEIWTPLARIGVRPPRPILPGRYEERLRQLEREKEDLRRIAYNIGGQNPNVQPIAGNRENQMPPGPNPALVAGAVEEVVNEDRHDILDNEQRVNRGHAEVPQLPAPNAQENEIGNDGLAGQEHEEVIEEGRRDVAEDLNRVPNEHDIAPGQHEPNNEERDYVMVNPDGLPRGLQTQNEIANQRVVQESRSHEEDIENVSSRSSPREQHR